MGRKTKIGLVQVPFSSRKDLSTNLDCLYFLGEQCLSEGAELVFFPEAYQHSDQGREIMQNSSLLREVSQKWKERCAFLAKGHKAYVVPWDYEIDENNKIYNTSYILDRSGTEVGRFRKVHLTYGEQMWGLTAGCDFPVFDLDFGKIGIMICFDNYWPESARVLALRGAELILYPLFGDTLNPQWELKMRARAIDNSVYVASCQISDNYDIAYTGLISPSGDILCKIDHEPAWQVVEVDLGRPVVTSTTGNKEYKENIAQYLNRCRNVSAYSPLLEAREGIWSWEDIFHGKRP